MPEETRPDTIMLLSQLQGHGSRRATIELWDVRWLPVPARALLNLAKAGTSNSPRHAVVLGNLRWRPPPAHTLLADGVVTGKRAANASTGAKIGSQELPLRPCIPTARFTECIACVGSDMEVFCNATVART